MVPRWAAGPASEAIGIARAAKTFGMPSVISFTLETDGRLPTAQALNDAIAEVDAATAGAPAYYMINCAHPTHFTRVLEEGADWVTRLRGLRANSSCRSHAELDNAPELDTGNPVELGAQYRDLRRRFPSLTVLGGCCGTDHHHVREIAAACC
jgi:S-methylmethionine-dependent homocysteine/selenocysteine methylase